MSSPEEFLSRLDHVVDDYETSGDAMRWSPEPVTPTGLEQVIATRLRTAMWVPPRVYVSTTNAEPVGGEDWVELASPPRVPPFDIDSLAPWQVRWIELTTGEFVRPVTRAASDVARALSRLGRSLGPSVVDEIAGWSFPGALDHADRISPEDEGPQQDPDKPGYPITLRQGVAAQQSPYGPKPRSRDGRQEMRGDDPRRARLSPTGRPRGSRSCVGDRDRP